jgi:ABC-type Fe3+-hydroxamate transport system substrate-binding protein
MTELISRRYLVGAAVVGLCLLLALSGCSGNSNEAEYLQNTSPGAPAEPESVASRRERTKSVPKTPPKGKRKSAGG